MPEPRIVTPQEAQQRLRAGVYLDALSRNLGHTVATENERHEAAIRAAVVKALRDAAATLRHQGSPSDAQVVEYRADAIENGAPYA